MRRVRHYIIVKYSGMVCDREKTEREIRALFAPAADIPGVHSVSIRPAVVRSEKRHDLMILLTMEPEALLPPISKAKPYLIATDLTRTAKLRMEADILGELSNLPNIGPVVERQLNAAGVASAEELRALGAKEAWLRIKAIDPSACIHRLLALVGAVRGVKKALLPPDVREELRSFYNANKA